MKQDSIPGQRTSDFIMANCIKNRISISLAVRKAIKHRMAPMLMGCTICLAMCGNGFMTGMGGIITASVQLIIRQDQKQARQCPMANRIGCCGEETGTMAKNIGGILG